MRLLLVVLALALAGAEATEWAKRSSRSRTMPTLTKPKEKAVVNRIIGGDYAFDGQFKYQVSMFLDDLYFCGGSLISPSTVMTAAHCAIDVSRFEVHAGTTYFEGGTVVFSRNAIVHEYYDDFSLNNDIAIVILPEQIFSEYIEPIRLPSRSMIGTTFVGEYARVSGWGRTSDSSTSISEYLMYVDVVVMQNEDCEAVYGDIINDSKICVDTNFGFQGTCSGDSGGPLIIFEHDGDPTQIAIVSFGASDGCEAGFPDGLTRVTEYLDWIETNTGLPIRP